MKWTTEAGNVSKHTNKQTKTARTTTKNYFQQINFQFCMQNNETSEDLSYSFLWNLKTPS